MSKRIVLPSLVVAVLALTALFGVLKFNSAYAQTPTTTPTAAASTTTNGQTATTTQDVDGPHGGHVGYSQQGLADALGIDLTKLQAAYTSANMEALKQAVTQGLITQAQADEITARGLSNGPVGGFKRITGDGVQANSIDYNALLANALGITSDQLNTAYLKAYNTAIDSALSAGTITQAQADLMKGRAALAADSTFQSSIQSAYTAAVNQAVTDGVITQAQADAILAAQQNKPATGGFGFGEGFSGGRGGHGGFRGGPMGNEGTNTPQP